MRTYLKNKLFFALVFFALFLTVANANAASGLVPCGLGANDPCTLCHLIVGTKGLIDWGMGILITLSLAAISIAGVMYIISSGDPSFTKKAKSFVSSVVIGFALMLGAWLIVNVTLWIFSAKEGTSGSGKYNLGLSSENWYTFTCSTVSSSTGSVTTGQGGVAAEPLATSFSCDNFTFQTTSIKSQCANGDASSALQTLMMCLKSKLGASMTVNSISDNKGFDHCANNYDSSCAHAKSSCHYGGTAKSGKSEAVDISTRTLDANTILSAASACGAGYTKDESTSANHIHISTTACKNS